MKILHFLIFSLLFAVACTQISCATDPCAKISCQNGGNCESGTCKCPNGYYGTNCEKGEVCRIASYTEQTDTAAPIAHTLTYDAQGRLVANASSTTTTAIAYAVGQIDETTTNSGSADYTKYKSLVNTKGYPTTVYTEYSSAGTITRDTFQYTYDANDYWASVFGRDFSINLTYANGNKVTRIYTDNGSTYYTATYEYYTNKTQPNSYEGQYAPKLGTREKNMRKKYTQNFTSGRRKITDYNYEYDAKGNVTKEIVVVTDYDSAGVVTATTTNTFTFTIACVKP
jgi:YD repeat-containing protein